MARTRVLESLSGGTRRFSLEVIPPLRGGDMESIIRAVESAMPWQPAFVSITDHAKAPARIGDGQGEGIARPRPGTLGTAVAIRERFEVSTVPHLVALGADRLSMEDLLIDLQWSGFQDLFVVRGDDLNRSPETEEECRGGGRDSYRTALDLVRHIADLNAGRYSPPVEGKPTTFVVGVAGYPEKHIAAPDFGDDMDRLVEKLDAGASFIITQMVFDARHYRRFVQELRRRGYSTPVIPGLKPILRRSSLDQKCRGNG